MTGRIEGYEGLYYVTSDGQVHAHLKRGSDGRWLQPRLLKGGVYPNGYRYVCLRMDGINKNHLVHRLIAKAFIPNPLNLPCVNHINGDKSDNHVINLEWCTHSHNIRHAVRLGLRESHCNIRRKVTMMHFGNRRIIEFQSMKECCDHFGFGKGWLGNRIRQYGNPCQYKGWTILVEERTVV